jgi:uncharacterized protein (TIGR03437 family)
MSILERHAPLFFERSYGFTVHSLSGIVLVVAFLSCLVRPAGAQCGAVVVSVGLSSSADTVQEGDGVVFTATVTPPAGGSITFNDGGSTIPGSPVAVDGNGVASIAAILAPGSHSVTAVLNSTCYTNISSSAVTVTVVSAFPRMTVTLNPQAPVIGQPVLFTVTLETAAGGQSATGTVQFLEGTASLGIVPVTNGEAHFSISLLGGYHTIGIQYSGDGMYPGRSANISLSVTQIGTTLKLSSDSATGVFGRPVTLTAALNPQSATGVTAPSGQVQFFVGSAIGLFGTLRDRTLLGSAALLNGAAALTVTSLPAGSSVVIATYEGDATWSASTSNTLTETVGKAPTAITWSSAAADATKLTLAVRVAAQGSGSSPTGTVQFVDTVTHAVLVSATLVAGAATAAVPSTGVDHSLAATYSGDDSFLSSTTLPLAMLSILNAAGYSGSSISPDEIISIFGSDLAPTTTSAPSSEPLATVLSGVTVQITDSTGTSRPAQLLLVSPAQANIVVPSDVAVGPGTLKLTASSGTILSKNILVTATTPGLFSMNGAGKGVAAAQIIRVPSGGVQSVESVAVFDSAQQLWVAVPVDTANGQTYLVLYGTGIRHRSSDQAVRCTINGVDAAVLYAGKQGSSSGLDQVNVELPPHLSAGVASIAITADGTASNTVTITIQ